MNGDQSMCARCGKELSTKEFMHYVLTPFIFGTHWTLRFCKECYAKARYEAYYKANGRQDYDIIY